MKRIKLLTVTCVLALVVLLLVACGGEVTTSADGSTSTETPAVTTEKPAPTKLTSLKIGDADISEYTIVYAQSPYATHVKMAQFRPYMEVYDFDHETAKRVAALIKELCGVTLSVKVDKSTTETEREILVGSTNRAQTSELDIKGLVADEYIVNQSGTKLVIAGGQYGTTWHAVDYVESLLRDTLANCKTEFAFDSTVNKKGTHHLVRIGCIGDSITDGIGASNELLQYTSQLGRYLWKDAIVYDFGSSGATMRDDLADTYTKRVPYTEALRAASTVDIFTIMLGTNDSDRDKSVWNSAKDLLYINGCKNIMEKMQNHNKDLVFVVANCPAYYDPNGHFGSQHVRELAESMIPDLNEAGFPTTFYDMYSVTAGHPEWFPDKLHPNDLGHKEMAKAWAVSLQEKIDSIQAK